MTGSQMTSSVPGARDIVAGLDKVHEPPPGLILRNDEEREYWIALMRDKEFKSWNATGLNQAYKVLRLEFMIRQGRARLDDIVAQGANPFDSESIAFDWMTNITKAERSQLSLIRALGLTYSAIQSASSTKPTQAATEMRHALKSVGEGNGLPGFMAVQ